MADGIGCRLIAVKYAGINKKTGSGGELIGLRANADNSIAFCNENRFQFFVPMPGNTVFSKYVKIAGCRKSSGSMSKLVAVILVHGKAAAVR